MFSIQKPAVACALIACIVISGCGSSATSSSSTTPAAGATAHAPSPSGGSSAGALSPDARSATTGDIPDNQVFLVFSSKAARFSIKYPEGWTQNGSGYSRTFRDKNNLVRILITRGAIPTVRSVATQLDGLKKSDPMLTFGTPQTVNLRSGAAIKVVYTTQSAPNPVTGKRVKLVVDRYELANGGRVATVDLGTPKGVDNVDAYRMMIESFLWL
jgi:hypothetical protein